MVCLYTINEVLSNIIEPTKFNIWRHKNEIKCENLAMPVIIVAISLNYETHIV